MQAHIARQLTAIPDLAGLNAPCEHAPPSAYRYPILYGKGDMGQMAREFCAYVGYEPASIDQADFATVPAEIKADWLCLVAVAKHAYVPIERALTEAGFAFVAPFNDWTENFPVHPLKNGWFADELHIGKVQGVMEMFADDASRKHYAAFLAWRRLREEWVFADAPVCTKDRYWPPEVASVLVQGHEMFVDGGSGGGKTSEAFAFRFGGASMRIDPQGEHLLPYALGENNEWGRFIGGHGYASRLSGPRSPSDHTFPVLVQRLDSLTASFRVVPTFIKLHLEGGELPALKGAVNTIRVHRPILAIACYHQPDTMTDIPLWLKEHCEGYRFLWRNHAYVGESAVMYAIPDERSC